MEIGEEAFFKNICKIPPLQHHHLQTCSAALIHELVSDDDVGVVESTVGTPVESVGIIMLSLPETQIDYGSTSQQDLFLTPSEDLHKDCDVGLSETLGCSQDRTNDRIADRVDASETLSMDDDCLVGEKVVDLGKDCDLGFSQSQTLGCSQSPSKDPVADCVDVGVTLSIDDLEGEKVVDLGKDSDSGSSIGMLSQIISAIEFKETVAGEKNGELEKSSTGKEDEVVVIVEDSLSEVVELVSGNDPTEVVESELKVDTAKNSDVNDNPSCSGVKRDKRKKKKKSSGVNLPKKGRALPASIIGGLDNLKDCKIPPDFLKNAMISIEKFIAENSVPKDDNGDDDKCGTLEAAMMCGVKFPRPSWWAPDYRPSWWPEGYGGC